MEYTIFQDKTGSYGIRCGEVVIVPCKYHSIKPVPHTCFFVVERKSGYYINDKLIRNKNVLDAFNDFALVFEEDFLFYDVVDGKVVPKRAEAPTFKKVVPTKPYRGYQF